MTTIREEVEAQHAAREQGMYALCQRLAGDLSTPSIRAAIRQHECSGITTEQLFDTILEARIAEAVAGERGRLCRVLCSACRSGLPLVPPAGNVLGRWMHKSKDGAYHKCEAHAIRGGDHDG